MNTYMPNTSQIERKWYVVDAAGQNLGRLSSQVAAVLRGKNKPTFTPSMDTGDYVIVINADKIKVTGKKLDQKIYYRHSDYVGGMKTATLREKLETADVSCDYNNVVLLGLGEYLALCGEGKVMDVLSECFGYRLGSAQVVFLLRCVESQVRQLIKNDKRLFDSGMVAFGDDLSTSVQFKFSDPGLGILSGGCCSRNGRQRR